MKAILGDNTMAPWRATEPGAVVLGELEVRPALPGEMQRGAALFNDEHYLGAGRQVGRALSEHESGAPVAVTIASKTEGELTAAKRIYQRAGLRNAVA